MLKLKDLVLQLKEHDFDRLTERFRTTQADKYLALLLLMRQRNPLSDEEIIQALEVKKGTYYTLRSRLYDKVQEFRMSTILGIKQTIIERVDNIPRLLYNTPKETAVAVLTKLEEELIKYDMSWELTKVYSALKKLHVNTNKYYDYSQSYNKHIAGALAAEKIEELVGDFFKHIGNYYVTREQEWLDYLVVIKEQAENYSAMFPIKHMLLYRYIIDISFALFVPLPQKTQNDAPVEDMLVEMKKILSENDKKQSYEYLLKIHALLSFEYYHNVRQTKKAAVYFDKANKEITLLLQYNFISFAGHFLRSKIEHYTFLGIQGKLYDENKILIQEYTPDLEDVPNYISYYKYLAISALHAQKYVDAINLLNTAASGISIRQCIHAEIEIKLFHAYCCCMMRNYEQALGSIKNAMYKIREVSNRDDYENAYSFARMLIVLLDRKLTSVQSKAISLKNKFLIFNQGKTKMLEYLPLTDEALMQISESMKLRSLRAER